MLCPPVSETAVEFDPTLGRLLAPWTAGRTPLFHDLLSDGDGVVRRYAIYELSDRRSRSPASRPPSRSRRGRVGTSRDEPPAADDRRAQGPRAERPASRDRQLAGAAGCPADGGLRLLAGDPARA